MCYREMQKHMLACGGMEVEVCACCGADEKELCPLQLLWLQEESAVSSYIKGN